MMRIIIINHDHIWPYLLPRHGHIKIIYTHDMIVAYSEHVQMFPHTTNCCTAQVLKEEFGWNVPDYYKYLNWL